jgi:hypothetical protein
MLRPPIEDHNGILAQSPPLFSIGPESEWRGEIEVSCGLERTASAAVNINR